MDIGNVYYPWKNTLLFASLVEYELHYKTNKELK